MEPIESQWILKKCNDENCGFCNPELLQREEKTE